MSDMWPEQPKGKRRVLITGIGGAIGCHMLNYILSKTDWEVVGLDSFRHKGTTDRLNIICPPDDQNRKRIKIFTHDLNAPMTDMLIEQIGRIDYIINLASDSHVDRSIKDPVRFIQNNTNLALYMLEYARIAKPKVFIQFSTDEVYGNADQGGEGHKEWSAIRPSNPYSASKAAQEAIAFSYWRTYGVPVIITNTMNNFGEMQDPEKFPAMVQRKIAAGEKVQIHAAADGTIGSRYYIHSEMVAEAVIFIIDKLPPYQHQYGHNDEPDRYNIVGEKEFDNLEFAQMIANLMGVKEFAYELVDFHGTRPGHDLRYALDGSKLKEKGWRPSLSVEGMLRRTINWQKSNKEWL